MSDFNKGDFTQQGVDGHVRATLRLNEKRYVELDLTTNENAQGCTISGNVHDRLNNIDYPIGSAPSGNIEITENTAEGEPLDISQYATATVNVAGGGEIPFFELTVVNNSTSICYPRTAFTKWVSEYNAWKLSDADINASESMIFEDLLYALDFMTQVCYIPSVFDNEGSVSLTYSASNLVNCSFADTRFIITDTSLPASATLTISSGGIA